MSLDDVLGIRSLGSCALVFGESSGESFVGERSFRKSTRRYRAPGNPSSGGTSLASYLDVSCDGVGLTSLALALEGGGETEKVGSLGAGPTTESALEDELAPGTSRSSGKVGVAVTIPILGTLATLEAARSSGLELAASFIDTARALAGGPAREGSFLTFSAGMTTTLEALSEYGSVDGLPC